VAQKLHFAILRIEVTRASRGLSAIAELLVTARRSYASAVLGLILSVSTSVCPSVCLSVRLSHVCFVTNPKNLPAIFLYHMKTQSF